MSDILVEINDQELTFIAMPLIGAKGIEENRVVFTFSPNWSGFSKTATFFHELYPDDIYDVVVDANDSCVVPHEVTAVPGKFYLGVTGVSGTTTLTSLREPYYVYPGSEEGGETSQAPTPDVYNQIIQSLNNVQGSPLVANTASAMTDTNKVYVYTGNQSGYTSGNWYYWNGSAWTSGGVYNSQGIGNDILEKIYDVYPTESATGEYAEFTDGADGIPVKSLSTSITGWQDGEGTPALDNIMPIHGFNSIDVVRTGKNLCPVPVAGYNINTSTGILSGSAGDTTLNAATLDFIPIDFVAHPNYVLSYDSESTLKNLTYVYNEKFQYMGRNSGDPSHPRPFSASSITTSLTGVGGTPSYVRIRLYVSSGAVSQAQVNAVNIQFEPCETPTTPTSYEPYTASKSTINLLETYSSTKTAGVYEGSLDIKTGLLTVTKGYKQFDGTEDWSTTASTNGDIYYQPLPALVKGVASADRRCSHLPNASIITSSTGQGYYTYNPSSTTSGRGQVRPTSAMSIADAAGMKAWCLAQYQNGTPMEWWWTYASAHSVQLTPTEVQTLLGYNNIHATSGNVNVIVRADIGKFIEKRLQA